MDELAPADERTAIGGVFRLVAGLALVWGVPPQTVLLFLAAEAPNEAEWGRLVGLTWDRLTPSSRATIEALAATGEEKRR